MTKALKGMNSLWVKHAWGILGASLTALTFFVSLIVLDQISSSHARPPASSQSDYAKQKNRIDKLENEVANLGKALDNKKKSSLAPTSPATASTPRVADPGSAQVRLYSPADPVIPGVIGGDNGSSRSNSTPSTPGASTPSSPEEPPTPAPSPTTDAPAPAVSAGVAVNVQQLINKLSCGLNGASECR